MAELDLAEFEWKLVIRNLTIDDFDALVDLQLKCFPGMQTWRREQLESQLKVFPEGQFVVQYDDQVVASASSLVVDFNQYSEWHNWGVMSDNGFIRNHDPSGDTLYGIEIMVDPEFRGYKLSRRLYDARKELCRELNLARIIIAGRIPGYGQVASQMSAREYVEGVMSKAYFDPVLTAQVANGFALKGLIPNYLPSDTDSRGYATFLEWTNLDYEAGAKRVFRRVEPVRLSVVQYQMRPINDFDEFATQCEFFVDVASDYKCDFVVFPELITTQLMSCVKSSRPGLAARQISEFTPQYLDWFTELAVKYDINIIGGTHFTVEDDVLYNIAYLFRRDGTIGKQYKLHVTPSERRWWGVEPGDRLEVFDTDCGKIAILICYDIEFPELARIAADKGAQVLFVPFNTDTRQGYLRVRHCAQARCIENHMYVAISGCTGNLPFVDNVDIHYAQSGIFTPADFSFSRDAVAEECTANIETIVIHDIDVELLTRHRKSGTVQNWNDRRRDMYRVVYDEDGQRHEI
ncbi:MAG: GNAT family N-acetyltransferase [Planctomycetales bacterium]|nr:GNAT family N-acetyltransferase [Planctomycetales bacterium]